MNTAAPDEATPKRRVNTIVGAIVVGLVIAALAAAYVAQQFVAEERARVQQAWQVRLGIVADSRTAAVNEWAQRNFAALRDLAENASLQLYMTELTLGAGQAPEGAQAEAEYLRSLLIATAQREGFTPPVEAQEIAANVERVGVAGIGLVDAKGNPVVSSPGMPPLAGRIRIAVAKALTGEPAFIDLFMGASGLPTVGFVLPVFAIQGPTEETEGIGAVVGVRVAGKDLYGRLAQPGDTSKTAETYLVRATGKVIEYLSPLADAAPLERSLATDTPDLAAAFALANPSGFAIKRDYAGETVLVTSRMLAALPWLLVRQITRDEALGPTDARLNTIFIVLMLIIVAVGIAIALVWRHGASLRAAAASERHRIEAENFKNISKFLRVVTDNQPTEIVAVDGDTQYTFANEPAASHAGITTEDMMGKTMASVIGPVRADLFAKINREVMAAFEPQFHVHRFEDGDEAQVLRTSHMPLRGDRKYPPGVLMVLDDITELAQERERSERMLRQLVDTLVSVVDRRDPFSAHHSTRVSEVSGCIAGEMGAPELDVTTVEVAGNLMNLGKIFVPAELLTKTEGLSDDERALLAGSYTVSAELLDGVGFEGPVVETIRQMGERWDGGGSLHLSGEDILSTARILAVANDFVAMISPRAYRGALSFEEVSNTLLEESGTRFDRGPVSALINYLENRGGKDQWTHFRDPPETI